MARVRTLIVDDSSLVREILKRGLSGDPDIEVVGTAADAFEARDLVVKLKPDVITLDLEMPRMTGIEFLKRLMKYSPTPTIIVSSLTVERAPATFDALAAGAVDVVAKPNRNVGQSLGEMMGDLRERVKAAANAKPRASAISRPVATATRALAATPIRETHRWMRTMLAIGASTGGTEALMAVLTKLPADIPPALIVQHMPADFTAPFAARLNRNCPFEVREAVDGDVIRPGLALLAPGSAHIRLLKSGTKFIVRLDTGALVSGHRPSVDVLFNSVAKVAGSRAVGAILTGMGSDGAAGMLAMRQKGARTVAQDEKSCVVYGMPRAAKMNGGAEMERSLVNIGATLVDLLQSKPQRPARLGAVAA